VSNASKVGFGKRDKLPDSKRNTRQQFGRALWRGSKPAAGTPPFDLRAFECREAAA
jgi:hypothetical protein